MPAAEGGSERDVQSPDVEHDAEHADVTQDVTQDVAPDVLQDVERGVLPLLSAADARAADAAAVAAGDTFDALMQRAAGHLARTVLEVAGRGSGVRVDLIVGKGDNGGDGWAAAPMLAARGVHVRVLAPDGTDVPTSEASARARARWIAAGGRVVAGPVGGVLVRDGRAQADVIVDCLLGTGAVGPLRSTVAEAAAGIVAARAAGALVVACDVPTGIDADDGTVADGAVQADVTVTLGGLKRGLLLAPASQHVGRVRIGRLGPRFTTAGAGDATRPPVRWWTLSAGAARPVRIASLTEKRRRGTVLVVAGRAGTAGAAALAGQGALAAGAGLVTVAVPEPIRAEIAAHHPALMTIGLPADVDGALHTDAVHALELAELGGFDAVVAGPGLGTGAGAAAVVMWLRRACPRLVLDADALNVHRDDASTLATHPRGPGTALVLTPHLRELDRLAGAGTYAERAVQVPALAVRWDAHVVAKGPGTLVAAPDGTVFVGPSAVPALATAGTGDVLAGMLGAALAAWGAPDPAAPRGGEGAPRGAEGPGLQLARTVWWHAAAGLAAGAVSGDRTDALAVLRTLPAVLSALAVAPAVRDPGPSGRVALEQVMLDSVLPGIWPVVGERRIRDAEGRSA